MEQKLSRSVSVIGTSTLLLILCMKDFPSRPSDRVSAMNHEKFQGKFQYLLP